VGTICRCWPGRGSFAGATGDGDGGRHGQRLATPKVRPFPPTNPINLVVVPFVDCVTANSDGSNTAFFGYYSFARSSTKISKSAQNQITPASLDGAEPTSFQSGYVPRAFSVKIPKAGTATWTLSGFPAPAPNTWSPACPPPVSLPQEGNGLGLVLGLIAAGVAGTVLISRMIARAAATA
jgi:hypothetical protein